VSASEIRGINEIMLFEEKTVTVSVVFDARDQSCKTFCLKRSSLYLLRPVSSDLFRHDQQRIDPNCWRH